MCGIVILTFYLTYYLAAGIYPDILYGIYSDILSDILSGIYSDIFSGIYSDILAGVLIISGISSEILCG